MKAQYTKIIEVTSTSSHVRLKVQLEGKNEGNDLITIDVIPHEKNVLVCVNGAKSITPEQTAANHVELQYNHWET